MKLKYKYIVVLLLTSVFCQAQVSLVVGSSENPRAANSTIEDAQFTIHPRGIYMEVGMHLTFSARGAKGEQNGEVVDFEASEVNLETLLRFPLPLGTMVTDSWLWINEDIIQADIEERWHATQIYQDIVGFRLDPSLLTKDNWSWGEHMERDMYTLRVFPLQPDSTRRVKITYLVPSNWSNGEVSIPLPTDILAASKMPVEKISIQCFLNNGFSNPRIPQLPNSNFTPTTHATLGNHFQQFLTNKEIENGIDVSFEVPMQDGVFLSTYQNEGRDYYQLAVLPLEALLAGASPPRKVAVLVDYDTSTTSIPKEILLAKLEDQLIAQLQPYDFFNIILSTPLGIQLVNPNWLSADEQTIGTIFNSLEENSNYTLSNTSQLNQLLDTGLEFIINQGDGGDLFLLACAEPFHDYQIADSKIEELGSLLSDFSISFHIADFQNKNLSQSEIGVGWNEETNWYESNIFYGNEYFYSSLNQQEGGYTHTLRIQSNLNNLLTNSLRSISPIQEIQAVNISKNNGSCFNQFDLPQLSTINPTVSFLQVGKCRGNFPFTIDIFGKQNDQTISRRITINEPQINKGNGSHITSWAGNFIYSLELNRPYFGLTKRIIEKIIEWSLEYRVLSLYTAFLALEEDLGGYVCKECIDETLLTQTIEDLPLGSINTSTNDIDLPSIDLGGELRDGGRWEPPLGDSIITKTKELQLDTVLQVIASPNPFHEGTSITVQLNQSILQAPLTYTIYDLTGQTIKSFPLSETNNNNRQLQLYWDGTNLTHQRVQAGIYILNIQSPLGQKNVKLLFIE